MTGKPKPKPDDEGGEEEKAGGKPELLGHVDCQTCGGPAEVYDGHPKGKGGLFARGAKCEHEHVLGASWRPQVRPLPKV